MCFVLSYNLVIYFILEHFVVVYEDDYCSFFAMSKNKSGYNDINVSQPTISVALTMISIPLSMIFWIANILFKKLYGDNANELNGKLILQYP